MTGGHEHLPAEIRNALASDLTIDITTVGRRSGSQHRLEIWFLNVDGEIYIAGTPGPRDWFANLMATTDLVFHLKESVHADLDACATVVTDRETRKRVFSHDSARWYSRQGDSADDVLASAPLVQIHFS